MAATDSSAIRYCDQCKQNVYLCLTDVETIAHAKTGDCIAREMPDGSELPQMILGRPANPVEPTEAQTLALRWSHRERGIDDAIKNSDAIRCCPKCGFSAPHWRVECRVCGFEIGRVHPENAT